MKRIPNLNTFSTLVDRLSIENVKLSHFENALEHDNPNSQQSDELKRKIAVQNEIIHGLKNELTEFMHEVLQSGHYDYIKEERTFK